MSIWAEAYDLPHIASPGKKVAWLPVLSYRFGRHADAFREEGQITLPTAYSRLDEVFHIDPADHANDMGSVIHLFQRGKVGTDGLPIPVGSFIAERRPDNLESPATSTTDLTGRGLTSYFLDRVRLWPFDYPADPTREDDWIFGGENILSNPGLEDGSPQSAQWSVWLDDGVDGGTWSIDIGGDVTDPFDWDATNSEIQTEVIDAIPGLIALTVSGSGTEEDPWILTVTDPSGDAFPSFTAIDIDLTNGSINFDTIRVGGGIELSGWQRSANLDRGGREHGRYASDGFRLTTAGEPVRTGSYALRVNGLTRFAGAMQVLSVIPGHRYTASVWVFTSSATDIFRFIIRDRFEGLIGGPDGLGGRTIPINTWTEFSFEFVAPTDQIIMRIAVVGNTVTGAAVNPSPFYVDDGFLGPGTGPTTIGDIWEQLLLDSGTDHISVGRDALTWLVPTFTELLDSNGDAWDSERSVTLSSGDTYGQIAEAFQRLWGYVHRIRYDREDNLYYFDVYNPGWVEVDHSTTTTGSLIAGMNILGGEVIRRAPDGTHFKVFGDDGIWDEGTDTDLLGSWGWVDGKFERMATADPVGLGQVIVQQLAMNLDQMVSFEFNMTSQGQVIPLQHFDIFHRVRVALGAKSSIPDIDRIVTSVVCSGKPGQAPDYQVFVNSDAFASTGAAALAEAVRRLLRKSQRRQKDFGGTVGGGAGGVPTVFIAADDASAKSQLLADVVGSSTEAMQEAADLVAAIGAQGRLVMSEGRFRPTGTTGVELDVPMLVCGFGDEATGIVIDDWSGGDGEGIFVYNSNATFRDFSFVTEEIPN